MNEETQVLLTMLHHRAQVAARLRELAQQLEKRANLHDLSKFKPDEFEGFIAFKKAIAEHLFGSSGYKAAMEKNSQVIELHFSRNRHHPEFHAGGLDDMTFIDLIELVCDWLGANATYDDIPFRQALEKQIERYKLTSKEFYLIDLIARHFGE